MENFRHKVFLTVVDKGSFTSAALDLGISQPAVSQNISELEKSAGRQLFYRNRGEVTLTPAGEILADYIRKISRLTEEMSMQFTGHLERNIRLAVSDDLYDLLLGELIQKFVVLHSGVSFTRCTQADFPDLTLSIKPSQDKVIDLSPDSIARIRMSIAPPQKFMDDFSAIHERYFEMIYQPSVLFADDKVSDILKNFLSVNLFSDFF